MLNISRIAGWQKLFVCLSVFALLLLPLSISYAATDSPVTIASNQEAFDYYLAMVEILDVSTGVNQAVFYSGPGNRVLAERFASTSGKITLETTVGGKVLDDLKLFEKDSPITPDQAIRVWSRISQRYAQQASGDVYCVVAGARPTGVFTTIEKPALESNSKVTMMLIISKL